MATTRRIRLPIPYSPFPTLLWCAFTRPANAISAPLWRRARTEESQLGDSIQRFGRRSSRTHEPAVERFDGVAPNRPDKDNRTSYQPQRPIHRRASLRLKDYLERYTQRF